MLTTPEQTPPEYPKTHAVDLRGGDNIEQLKKAARHAGATLYVGDEDHAAQTPRIVFPNAFSMFAYLRLTKKRRPRLGLKTPIEKITRRSDL